MSLDSIGISSLILYLDDGLKSSGILNFMFSLISCCQEAPSHLLVVLLPLLLLHEIKQRRTPKMIIIDLNFIRLEHVHNRITSSVANSISSPVESPSSGHHLSRHDLGQMQSGYQDLPILN